MKRSINLSVLAAISFMLLLMLLPYAAQEGSALYAFLYSFCFIIPTVTVLLLEKRIRIPKRGLRLLPVGRDALLLLPLVLPCIATIMAISYVTSYLLSLTGVYYSTKLSGSVTYVFLTYAIIPAVGEELLFRFVPLKLIAPFSKKSALFVSAILFSAVHANLFQLPYAFFAGMVFAVLDIMTDSILPSVALHLINNALSVTISMFGTLIYVRLILALLAVLLLASIITVVIKRRAYIRRLSKIDFKEGEIFTAELLAFVAFALIIAVMSAFSSYR